MKALSHLYERDFIVFQDVNQPPENVTMNGYPAQILLCYSREQRHFDSVYGAAYMATMAMCQGLAYEILYGRVYGLGGEMVHAAVRSMLYDKAYAKLHKNHHRAAITVGITSTKVNDAKEEAADNVDKNEVQEALSKGVPPFPYKVAKALDICIYRNVELDIWNEAMKEAQMNESKVIPEFGPGVQCLLKLEEDQKEFYHGHIQSMTPGNGPVTVFVVELGKMCTVPYENLEHLPLIAYKKKKNKVKRSHHIKALTYSSHVPLGTNLKSSKRSRGDHSTLAPPLSPNASRPESSPLSGQSGHSNPYRSYNLQSSPTSSTSSQESDQRTIAPILLAGTSRNLEEVVSQQWPLLPYTPLATPFGVAWWIPALPTAGYDTVPSSTAAIPLNNLDWCSHYYVNFGCEYFQASGWPSTTTIQATALPSSLSGGLVPCFQCSSPPTPLCPTTTTAVAGHSGETPAATITAALHDQQQAGSDESDDADEDQPSTQPSAQQYAWYPVVVPTGIYRPT